MADNVQKTPIGLSINRHARTKALDAIQQRGQSLPCTVVSVRGSIVTVNFEISGPGLPNVTVPVIGSEYIRLPIQPKDKGWVLAADAYLGGVSGLGGGIADLTQRANLTALVFSPIGNTGFSTVNGNAVTIYGPDGVVLRDTNSQAVITLTPGNINLSAGGHSIVISSAGVVIDGITFGTHYHTGVQTGGGDTGPPA